MGNEKYSVCSRGVCWRKYLLKDRKFIGKLYVTEMGVGSIE